MSLYDRNNTKYILSLYIKLLKNAAKNAENLVADLDFTVSIK